MSFSASILLQPQEKIVRVLRRVPVADAGHYFLAALFLLTPFFFLFPLLRWQPWGYIIGGALLFVGLFILGRTIFLWWNNIFIITTERLIDIDQRGFFNRIISQSPLAKIQDVSCHIHGVWGTTFRFGDINIKWASGAVTLHVPYIYQPTRAQRLILDVQEDCAERYRLRLGKHRTLTPENYDAAER